MTCGLTWLARDNLGISTEKIEMSDIFISYTRNDRPKAEQLARAFEAHGWSVWWDRKIPAGRTFDEVIEEAVAACRCLVVLWSKKSVDSRWVRTEAGEGANRGILVPVLLEEVTIPLAFRRIQAFDLSGWNGEENSPDFQGLVSDIQHVLKHSPPELTSTTEFQGPIGTVTGPPKAPHGDTRTQESKRGLKKALLPLGIAATIVTIAMILAVLLRISRFFVQRGIDAENVGRIPNALKNYQRAIFFNSGNERAHFRLANIYEDLNAFPKAQSEYREAMEGGCIEAYNNLARLHIVQDLDYSAATALLRKGQYQLENRDRIEVNYCSQASQIDLRALEYSFLTNLGWAHLMTERLAESESQLREAIELYEPGAAPHCLLAQVLERKTDEDTLAARVEWQKCDDYASTLIPEEDR